MIRNNEPVYRKYNKFMQLNTCRKTKKQEL